MAESYKMNWVMKGEIGYLAKISVNGVENDATKRDNFSTFLDANSKGKVQTASLTLTDVSSTPPDAGSNVDRRLVCFLKDASDNATVRVTIPAPIDSIVVAEQDGERATNAFLLALAAEIVTLTGRVHTPLHGYVIQKK